MEENTTSSHSFSQFHGWKFECGERTLEKRELLERKKGFKEENSTQLSYEPWGDGTKAAR